MQSLANLAFNKKWDECHAMRDRGHGDVHQRKHDRTALQSAAKYGQLDLVDKILARGADIEAKDSMGWTPLHCAASNGQFTAAVRLAEKGADLTAKDKYAVTLAERTLEEGHTDLAAWFDLASATSTLITHLTSQLKELFMTLHLPDKLPVAVEWCIQQGADDIEDLRADKHATALASHLWLPPIKHDKLVDALVSGGS